MLSACGESAVIQALYKYRPASVWALVRLTIADEQDRMLISGRYARAKKHASGAVSDPQKAVDHAYDLLSRFSTDMEGGDAL